MDVIWTGGVLLVAGPDTRAHLVPAGDPSARTRTYTGLRFAPGTGADVLGVPAAELRDRRVPLDAVWPAGEVRVLAERLAEAEEDARRAGEAGRFRWPPVESARAAAVREERGGMGAAGVTGVAGVGAAGAAGPGVAGTGLAGAGLAWAGVAGAEAEAGAGPVGDAAARVLERHVRERLAAADRRPDPLMPGVAARLAGGASVAAAAEAAGLGERRLHRLSLASYGYGPKTLARILRFGRALDLVRAGERPAFAAVLGGYADQPHFAREVKALAGIPLRELLAEG